MCADDLRTCSALRERGSPLSGDEISDDRVHILDWCSDFHPHDRFQEKRGRFGDGFPDGHATSDSKRDL